MSVNNMRKYLKPSIKFNISDLVKPIFIDEIPGVSNNIKKPDLMIKLEKVFEVKLPNRLNIPFIFYRFYKSEESIVIEYYDIWMIDRGIMQESTEEELYNNIEKGS